MKVWLGFHPSIGIVIYDPARQIDIEASQVRLWNVNAQEFASRFTRAFLRRVQPNMSVNADAQGRSDALQPFLGRRLLLR